jgi:hypothetical protein
MVQRLDAWDRFADPRFWWLQAMVALWALFTLMLFVAEPLILHRWFHARAARDADAAFALVQRLHVVLLALGVATLAAGVLGAHGALP